MPLKLVRVDADEPDKIQLSVGKHLIGRGKFLNCEDKRISRNHGNLIVSEHSVAIEALHQNPCFFTRKGTKETQVLKKSCKETLDNGDRFGLLPGSYWYEVLQCTAEADSEATDVSNIGEQNSEIKETNDKNDHDNDKLNETIQTREPASGGVAKADEDNERLLDLDLNEAVENVGRLESPSLRDQESQKEQASCQPSNEPVSTLIMSNQTNEQETRDFAMESKSSSPKRSHTLDGNVGEKEVKTEPLDVKQEPDDAASCQPSNEPVPTLDTSNQTNKQETKDFAMESKSSSPNRSHTLDGNVGEKECKTEPLDVKQEPDDAASCQPSNEPAPTQDTSNQTNEPETTDSDMEPKSPSTKRSHSPDGNDWQWPGVKKIKTETSEDVKQELLVKQEPDDAMPGPSNDQAGASSNANDASKVPPSPAKPPNRERCMYGADCYRKNPQHKAQFSHPADADWGRGERAACPHGAACRRRDPRHWLQQQHPPGARPPPPAGAQIVERHGNIFYINAHSVNFYDDHLHAEGSDGDSADIDYEF